MTNDRTVDLPIYQSILTWNVLTIIYETIESEKPTWKMEMTEIKMIRKFTTNDPKINSLSEFCSYL